MIEPDTGSRPLVGIAVIVVRGGNVLLGKRKNAHGKGTWALPGGHLEFCESIEDCARREVLEETGMQISGIRQAAFTSDVFENEKKHYVTLFVTAAHEAGEAEVREPEKCEDWKWFSWEDLPSPLFLPLANLLAQGLSPLKLSFATRNTPPPTAGIEKERRKEKFVDKIDEIVRRRKKAHKKLLDLKSKTYRAFLAMESAAYADGALEKKHKELIAVGISVVIDCESCMQWHIQQAAEAGASESEVLEALEVGMEMGGGPATVSARFALEVMEETFTGKKDERSTSNIERRTSNKE